jgi:hypothetical protein
MYDSVYAPEEIQQRCEEYLAIAAVFETRTSSIPLQIGALLSSSLSKQRSILTVNSSVLGNIRTYVLQGKRCVGLL